VRVQRSGDQPGGLLRGVQGVQGEQHAGHVQRGEQVFGDGGLAALVGDLPLAQDRRLLVGDRGDQEYLPGGGARAVQQFPVDRDGGQQPSRCRMGDLPGRGAALLA
jgi:hypothetical protein